MKSLKRLLAANLLDAPRYTLPVRFPGLARTLGYTWVDLKNRHERLLRRSGQRGVACDWLWCSALFHCQNYPDVGKRLLRTVLDEWPIRFGNASSDVSRPEVTFIIGHRGLARLRHLLATVSSIGGQEGTAIECLVIEQAPQQEVASALPSWVRYIHRPPPRNEMPYSRAWAFNVAAREARGRILVFHDNDVCVPARYAAELVRIFDEGFEAARLQRFVFYLSRAHTSQFFDTRQLEPYHGPEQVVQNCEGHTIAVARDIYFEVGGHDEAFLGWGGEDNEFFDRLRTRRLHECAYLPFVHLHHEPQPGKGATHSNTSYFETRMRIPAHDRIVELAGRPLGHPAGPLISSDHAQPLS
jgi:hypothetical protein